MIDAAMWRELAAMVHDRAEFAMESEEERQVLVVAEDCEEQMPVSMRPRACNSSCLPRYRTRQLSEPQ